jgi:Protein of unknwon function (DUF3310)
MTETPATYTANALEIQIGGSHYKKLAIQPAEYIEKNGLSFLAGNVVKYATRHRDKGGADDIRKAIHCCELILALEYGDNTAPGGTGQLTEEETL